MILYFDMNSEIAEKVEKLKKYFENRDDILMAFLFGSYVKGQTHAHSDIDIAVYFKPKEKGIEFEETREYEGESALWGKIEKILNMDADMVVLNRAGSALALSIISEGQFLVIKDQKYFAKFRVVVENAAKRFLDFSKEFFEIKERSHSLSELDRGRLRKTISFLKDEIKLGNKFSKINQFDYQRDPIIKRAFERWVENVVNASVDISKVILASEKRPVPNSYRAILQDLSYVKNFDSKVAEELGNYAKVRNVLAHEYLDLRFAGLKKFVDKSESFYQYLIDFAKKFVSESEKVKNF